MKKLLILIIFLFVAGASYGQTAPPAPQVCLASGKFILIVTGSTSFTFNGLTDFSVAESNSNLNINVQSNSSRYRVYIAGEILGLPASSSNTPIPISTFSVQATDPGTGPITPITLTGNTAYQILVDAPPTKGATGRDHQITLTRGILNTFKQAPGNHSLFLHIRICQY